MRRCDRLLVIALGLLAPAAAFAQGFGLGAGVPDAAMVYPRGGATSPGLDFIFSSGSYYQNGVSACVSAATCLTVTRATTNGSATDLLPASASGQTITTFANNTARVSGAAGGLIVEEARVNQLLNATAPVTQTTASLGAGTYTLWVNGSGSATMSAGTGTGCGTGAATQGTPVNFTITIAGTCTVTVAGSLNAFQLEFGTFGTSLCTSGASACSRGADVISLTNVPAISTQYSFMAAGTTFAPHGFAANAILGSLDSGVSNNWVILYYDSAGTNLAGGGVDNAGTSTFAFLGATINPGTPVKMAGSFAPGAQIYSANGTTPVTTAAAAITSGITAFHIGSWYSANAFWNGTVSRTAVWPTVALTGVQLQALTK